MLNWRSPKLCNPMPLFKKGPCGLPLYALTIQLTVDDVDDEANDGAKQNSLLSELTPGWLHNHHKHIPAEHFWTNVTKCQPNRNGSDSVENKPLSLGLLCVCVCGLCGEILITASSLSSHTRLSRPTILSHPNAEIESKCRVTVCHSWLNNECFIILS